MRSYMLRAYMKGWERDWNDPMWLKQHSNDPILGGLYKTRYQELYDAEENRYWNDFYRNTGSSGSQYWTRRGENYSTAPTFGAYAFEASEAVMSLYNSKLWKVR